MLESNLTNDFCHCCQATRCCYLAQDREWKPAETSSEIRAAAVCYKIARETGGKGGRSG